MTNPWPIRPATEKRRKRPPGFLRRGNRLRNGNHLSASRWTRSGMSVGNTGAASRRFIPRDRPSRRSRPCRPIPRTPLTRQSLPHRDRQQSAPFRPVSRSGAFLCGADARPPPDPPCPHRTGSPRRRGRESSGGAARHVPTDTAALFRRLHRADCDLAGVEHDAGKKTGTDLQKKELHHPPEPRDARFRCPGRVRDVRGSGKRNAGKRDSGRHQGNSSYRRGTSWCPPEGMSARMFGDPLSGSAGPLRGVRIRPVWPD